MHKPGQKAKKNSRVFITALLVFFQIGRAESRLSKLAEDDPFINSKIEVLEIDQEVSLELSGAITEPSRTRILQNPKSEHPIRIFIDSSRLEEYTQIFPQFIKRKDSVKKLLASSKKYFRSFFNVTFNQELIFPAFGYCNGIPVPAFTKEIDLYIVVEPINNPLTQYVFAGGACKVSSIDGRPIMGAIYVNFARFEENSLQQYFYFYSAAREMFHILGFAVDLFKGLRTGSGKIRQLNKSIQTIKVGNSNFTAITLSNFLTYIKDFYECDKLEGLPLSKAGQSSGLRSFWEEAFIPGEIMSTQAVGPAAISSITLQFMNETGWYSIDPGAQQYYAYGKSKGCVQFQICPKGDSYCIANQTSNDMCSPDFLYKSKCQAFDTSGSILSSCYTIRPITSTSCIHNFGKGVFYMNREESYGAHSRCFLWREKTDLTRKRYSECHLAKCVDGKVKIKLKNGNVYTCMHDGQELNTGTQFNLICPKAGDFCTDWSFRCPMDCYGNGLCLKGNRCFCFDGFSGPDCGTCDGCLKGRDTFVLSANFGGANIEDYSEDPTINVFGAKVLGSVAALIFVMLITLIEV